jgi:hypothetical protein
MADKSRFPSPELDQKAGQEKQAIELEYRPA